MPPLLTMLELLKKIEPLPSPPRPARKVTGRLKLPLAWMIELDSEM